LLGRDSKGPTCGRIQVLKNGAFSHELVGLLVWIRHAGKEFANLFSCLGFQETVCEIDGFLANGFDLCKSCLGHLTGLRDLNAVEADPAGGTAFLVTLFVALFVALLSVLTSTASSSYFGYSIITQVKYTGKRIRIPSIESELFFNNHF